MIGHKPRGYREKPRVPPGASRLTSPIQAPGNLGLIQAFLNTAEVAGGGDRLAEPRDLSDWLASHGLLAVGSSLTDADLARARDVRGGLRALAALNAGEERDETAVVRLDRAGAGARAQVRFDRYGDPRLELASRDFDDALGTLLGFVHAAVCAGKWPAFKLCANPACRRAFFDFTKNLSGRWCCRRCGERIRSRHYRRRRARY